jgi:hypothetical protein
MTKRFTEWLSSKWRRNPSPDLLKAYLYTFNTPHGQMVLRDWLDEIYCQACPVNDPLALAEHNGQRKFIQRVLEALDQAETPGKYAFTEEMTHVG